MTSPSTEPFEVVDVRLLALVWDWAGQADEPVDAAGIARSAVAAGATRHPGTHQWSAGLSLRMVLGLAVLLLAGTAFAIAAATLLRPTGPSDGYRAVVTREVGGGLDVVLADADGSQRMLRHATVAGLGLDPRYVLEPSGSVNQGGWLELRADGSGDDRTGLARWGVMVLVDLADPAKAPIVLPAPGFTNGDWGPDGRYALFCTDSSEPPNCGQPLGAQSHQDIGAVRVLDLDRGMSSEIVVPNVQTFGGGPGIFWTADGSGFLARRGTQWGVTPIDGGDFIPGAPRLLSGEMDPSGTGPVASTLESGPFRVMDVSDGDSDHPRFVLAPVGSGDQTVTTGPVIEGWLAGLVPASASDAWPGP